MNINNYRLTSIEDPPEEFLSQIMQEAAQDASKENQETIDLFFANIRKEISKIQKEWEIKITSLC